MIREIAALEAWPWRCRRLLVREPRCLAGKIQLNTPTPPQAHYEDVIGILSPSAAGFVPQLCSNRYDTLDVLFEQLLVTRGAMALAIEPDLFVPNAEAEYPVPTLLAPTKSKFQFTGARVGACMKFQAARQQTADISRTLPVLRMANQSRYPLPTDGLKPLLNTNGWHAFLVR